MALWRRDKHVVAPPASNAIVAASYRVRPDLYRNMRIPTEQWQSEAWRQYDINGELRFACTWLGNALSRCRLTGADVGPGGDIIGETTNDTVQELMAGLAGSPGKQAELLMLLGTHMTVPGDAYIVATVGSNGTFENWEIVSNEEIRNAGDGKISIDNGDGKPRIVSLTSALVFRIYRPHPRKSFLATSPTQVGLPVLREIEQLTKYQFAVMDSRLAGAGILLLPSELEFPSPGDDIEPGESPFIATLAAAMMASIQNRSDARAVVPIVVQGPKDALGTAQWLVSPAMQLTTQASEEREKAIRRFAVGADMPPEALLGLSGGNHWAAWAIEESGIKLHIEPVMTLICSAFTEGYLKPALEAAGLDPQKYAVWFDPSNLVLRPNRATDGKDLWDRGLISGAALREAAGFTERDAPQGQEACLKSIEIALKAAPNLGEPLIKILVKLLGLDKCGISESDIVTIAPIQGNPGGTTPQITQPPPPPATDPNAPPVPGVGGNGG